MYKHLCVIFLQHDILLSISNIKMINVTHRHLSITWVFYTRSRHISNSKYALITDGSLRFGIILNMCKCNSGTVNGFQLHLYIGFCNSRKVL